MLQGITFDKSIAEFVLEAFGKTVSKEGYLIEQETGEHVLSKKGEHILLSEFGGIVKGSEIYLKSDIASMIDFIEKQA